MQTGRQSGAHINGAREKSLRRQPVSCRSGRSTSSRDDAARDLRTAAFGLEENVKTWSALKRSGSCACAGALDLINRARRGASVAAEPGLQGLADHAARDLAQLLAVSLLSRRRGDPGDHAVVAVGGNGSAV